MSWILLLVLMKTCQPLTKVFKEVREIATQTTQIWIFVGGLDPSVSDETLWGVFGQFGEQVHVKIPYFLPKIFPPEHLQELDASEYEEFIGRPVQRMSLLRLLEIFISSFASTLQEELLLLLKHGDLGSRFIHALNKFFAWMEAECKKSWQICEKTTLLSPDTVVASSIPCCRVPRSLLPGIRSSRLKDRQKEEHELLVKKEFSSSPFR
uniref:RRM domain-containing protein n=1 Tax=Lactuca sativa TaxID=4236 RepID=A0A9R1UPM1_LACSA|nr:hypothetical protein LSAT_V11C800444840 [Lactuca sativa]